MITNMTLKNPLGQTMVLERQSSAFSKPNLSKEYTNNNFKNNPINFYCHNKNKSTINISNNQINQSIEVANKNKITLKKTEAFKHILRKEKEKENHNFNLNALIKNLTNNNSRSRSKSNLDQTNTTLTKTSSDPATTTSKRLFNDNMLKTSAHKMYIDNLKNSIMKNLSSSLMTQLEKKKPNVNNNSFASNYSNNIQTEINEANNIPIQYTNTEILKTIANSVIEELEPITLDLQEAVIDLNAKEKQKTIPKKSSNQHRTINNNSNQPSTGTLISEESPFNSKPQSNSNTHNNSFSFKQSSNKQSSNSSINPSEKKCNIPLL